MPRESMLGYLIRKEAFVRAIAESVKKDEESIVVKSALKTIARQRAQIARVNSGNPLTGEGITK